MAGDSSVRVYTGDALATYHFGAAHPFGPERYPAFFAKFTDSGLADKVQSGEPREASLNAIEAFHEPAYVQRVRDACATESGPLDLGDTPAVKGLYEASLSVVGTVVAAIDAIMAGGCKRAFVPIAGLHHARRQNAAGFCVFNDCGVAIEHLRKTHGISRILYVDIDAHHGDGVYYGFEDDPELFIVDFHEDGDYLYPGTGSVDEAGKGAAAGTKLNIPMPPGANDDAFFKAWKPTEAFMEKAKPEFIMLQCGADSVVGDPLTHLEYTTQVHGEVAARLASLADEFAEGRLLALGGGGYNTDNLSSAWCEVINGLIGEPTTNR